MHIVNNNKDRKFFKGLEEKEKVGCQQLNLHTIQAVCVLKSLSFLHKKEHHNIV